MLLKLRNLLITATLFSAPLFADTVVATYKDGKVTDTEVMEQLRYHPEFQGKSFSQLNPETQKQLITNYVITKILAKNATDLQLQKTKEVKEKLQLAENQIIIQALIDYEVKKNVTPAAIEAEYKSKNWEAINTSHILVKTEAEAKKIKEKLDKGADFGALAKEYSEDSGSKENGGNLGYASKGSFVPEYEAVAYSLKPGQISDPVQSQFGWHIIKLIDKKPVSKETAEPMIKQQLTAEVIKNYVEKIEKGANIQIQAPK